MEGYLEIWHGFFKRWEKQYFRIHQQTLMFGPKKQVIENKVHLKIAQVITSIDDPVSFIIHTGTETLRIRAFSIQERVIWFKKLKAIQKEVEQSNYIKQISSIDNKNTKVKALQQLTIELWQCHADLQNVIDQITHKVKISPIKSLIDKIRITVQEIKLKNSSALKILQEHIMENSRKRSMPQQFRNNLNDSSFSFDGQNNDQTRFLSFMENNQQQNSRTPHKLFQRQQSMSPYLTPKSSLFQTFSNQQNQLYLQKRKSSYLHKNYNNSANRNKFIVEDSSVQLYQPQLSNNVKQRIFKRNLAFAQLKLNLPKVPTRNSLPEKFVVEDTISVMDTFKGVGLDITRFSFPVTMNQPISMLQKGCQRMYYSTLLDEANMHSIPQFRLLYVTAFIISQYATSQNRFKKPSNPLLGETFEYIDEQRQFQFLSEQVCHHPPISALHVRSNNYQFIDNSRSKIAFTGTSIKFVPESKGKIILQKNKDQYIFNKCTTNINGLLSKMYIENAGKMEIVCKKFGTKAVITFRENSFWSKQITTGLQGKIYVGQQQSYVLTGKWNKYLSAIEIKTNKNINLWQANHTVHKDYYNFNDYTFQLNHLNQNLLDVIAPTDCRLRPDQRALEYRNIELATSQKNRLEQKQRTKRKQNQQRNIEHKMLWFQKHTDQQGNQFYHSNNLYWVERRKGQWQQCLDIF